MCLLIVCSRIHDGMPLIVGANRDEQLARPAVPMTVLRDTSPRIVGGRDEVAGGTWLAVNDAGVVAGLTNRPLPDGRDLSRRSRGELPMLLAGRPSADAAVDAFTVDVHPGNYNPCWLVVADRRTAYFIDLTDPEVPAVRELPPGVHVLENRAIDTQSPKLDHVRRLVAGVERMDGADAAERLRVVLGDNTLPAGEEFPGAANCVHTDRGYGTRWSAVISVADDQRPPALSYADGPPCVTPFVDAAPYWS
ncbi:MAG TPA: NRDE family protein [Acidimicrobiales bacterium]|nr:NRDE family protein [Acidimicrobiales bacterium]